MNITIYKNPEGGYEFSGTRSDRQTINGSVDTTQTIEQFIEQVENTKTADELENERKKEDDLGMKLALVEMYEMIISLTEPLLEEISSDGEEPPSDPTTEENSETTGE